MTRLKASKENLPVIAISTLVIGATVQFSAIAADDTDAAQCLLQHVVHADGTVSEPENNRLRYFYDLIGVESSDLSGPCDTTLEKAIETSVDLGPRKTSGVLMMAAYMANADQSTPKEETVLLEDILEKMDRKRDAGPLLTFCEGEVPKNPDVEKLAMLYSLGGFSGSPLRTEEDVVTNCLIRTMIHVDGGFSTEEKALFEEERMEFTPEDLQSDCMIPRSRVLNQLTWLEKPTINAAMVTLLSVLAQKDGQILEKEDVLLVDVLNDLGKSTDTSVLFELTKGTFDEKMLLTVDAHYQYGAGPIFFRAKRSEVPLNLKGIKRAMEAYEYRFDSYIECTPKPPKPSVEPQAWTRDMTNGFHALNWSPDGNVRGSYSVTTTATDFTITGISDVDGDGVQATYVATKSTAPVRVTPEDVY